MNEINPRAVQGNNNPPLSEVLVDETASLQKRADDLVASAGRAAVTDDETAGKATLLAKMIREHTTTLDKAREERKRPYLESGRTVDLHFNNMINTLKGAQSGVTAMIDHYRRQKEAEAAEERRRLEEEARVEREKAEAALAAQRAAEERERLAAQEAARKIQEAEAKAAEAGNKAAREKAAREAEALRAKQDAENAAARSRALQSEIEDRARRDAAAELEKRASEVKSATISSSYGAKASGRKVFTAVITDLTKALKHARSVDEAAIRAAVQSVFDKQIRAGVCVLPGAEVKEDSTTVIR